MVFQNEWFYFCRGRSLGHRPAGERSPPSYCSEGVLHGFRVGTAGEGGNPRRALTVLFCEACEIIVSVILPEFLRFFLNNLGVLICRPDII